MLLISELIELIDSYKAQNVKVLQNPFTSQSKYSMFYRGIKEGVINNDEDASKLLYNCEPQDHKYKKLKYRFRQRLLNSLFFIDVHQPNYTDIQKAYYSCYKNWATINILFGKGAKKSAIAIAEKTLRQAQKFEFTEVVCNISRILRLNFATTKGDKRKFNFYNKLYKEQSRYLEAETLAEELYGDLIIDFVGSRATKKEYSKKADQYAEQLSQHLSDLAVPTYNFLFFAYSVIVLKYEIINDHKNVIIQCQKAYVQLNEKSFQLKMQIFPFVFKCFTSYIMLEKYRKAKMLITPCRQALDEGLINWFTFNQVHFIFLLHTSAYHEAYELLYSTLQHPRMKFQSDNTQEVWKVYEAYAHYVNHSKINNEETNEEKVKGNFKIGKFLNEVPAFSKDKRGLNIAILIIQILLLLQQKKYNKVIDRVSGLERYATRYLRKNETYRENCFIHMLLQIPRGNFNVTAVQRHAKKYVRMLAEISMNESSQSIGIEIVPYQVLWSAILLELD